MSSTLVIITFLAGNAWGPIVSSMPVKDNKACLELRNSVATDIIEGAKMNVTVATSIERVNREKTLVLVARTAAVRDLARLTCY